jgi:YgiT-type zinc finger domain-containing protein
MRCVLCRQGETHAGQVAATLQRGETIVIIKQVPADVCENCGEYYLSKEVTSLVLQKGEEAVHKGAEIAEVTTTLRSGWVGTGLRVSCFVLRGDV